jgi:hypothetical protein
MNDSQYFTIADSESKPGDYGSIGVFKLGPRCRGMIRILPKLEYMQKCSDYLKKVCVALLTTRNVISCLSFRFIISNGPRRRDLSL